MELFSEIYSCYYSVIAKVLEKAGDKSLSRKEITHIVNERGFSESAVYILPRLIEGEWKLLQCGEDGYKSKVSGNVKLPLTLLQKSWLKALLRDRRIALFLRDEELLVLEEKLKGVEPLFNFEDFHYFDVYRDGDNYSDEAYIRNFRCLLQAIRLKKIVKISFEGGKGGHVTGTYLPIKLEYSTKDDKFRVYAIRIRYGKMVKASIINIGRIDKAELLETFEGEIDFHEYMSFTKCSEPVVIQISRERNAVERCMLHFANYEKRTEYDDERDRYICYIYYDMKDETELLIRILSFGPVIKVLGPPRFLNQVRQRVRQQGELMGII